MGNVQVFEELREEEALSLVNETRVGSLDVVDTSVTDRCLEVGLDALESRSSANLVLLVASRSPCVEVRLEGGSELATICIGHESAYLHDFRTEVVVAGTLREFG